LELYQDPTSGKPSNEILEFIKDKSEKMQKRLKIEHQLFFMNNLNK